MGKQSKWAIYDSQILEVLSNSKYNSLGYSEIAREVLGEDSSYTDIDLLRTYIRRNFDHLRNGDKSKPRILVYDLETSLVQAHVFWTGKQYIHSSQLMGEPMIITVAYKWLGEDKVHTITWDEEEEGFTDRRLLEEFLVVYNTADMVIGINNRNFDDRWVNARALKHGLYINTYLKSFDIQRKAKSMFRLPGYSMKYLAEYLGVTLKQDHEGIKMWKKVQFGNPQERKEYLQKMLDYNVGDIVSTEELYYRMRRYMKGEAHFGVLGGSPKWACPECGGTNVELVKTTITRVGTIQRIMRCNDDDVTYKISNTEYTKFLER